MSYTVIVEAIEKAFNSEAYIRRNLFLDTAAGNPSRLCPIVTECPARSMNSGHSGIVIEADEGRAACAIDQPAVHRVAEAATDGRKIIDIIGKIDVAFDTVN